MVSLHSEHFLVLLLGIVLCGCNDDVHSGGDCPDPALAPLQYPVDQPEPFDSLRFP